MTNQPETFKARYNSRCPICDRTVHKGNRTVKRPGCAAAHPKCDREFARYAKLASKPLKAGAHILMDPDNGENAIFTVNSVDGVTITETLAGTAINCEVKKVVRHPHPGYARDYYRRLLESGYVKVA